MTEFNALRPITQRLTSTPVEELPHIAYFLASSIATCGKALQSVSSQSTGRSNDNAVLVHKLKTRISTLLQERSHEGRFTAVVLVKAVVEAGGREILSSSSESWVRGLLAMLGRPDSVSTKRLCLVTLTRMFSLTEQYPTLVREITTPLLPAFITACLALIKPKSVPTDDGTTTVISPFVEPVLRSFSELLPHHPTIFRPFTARLNTIALTLIGSPSMPLHATDVASNILTSLHFSAANNAAGAEWVQTCKSIILSCHMAADHIFRPVIEDWEGSEHMESLVSVNRNYEKKVEASGSDVLGLRQWTGVHDGTQRIVKLLGILMKFLSLRTAQTVSCPIGSVIDLTARLAAVTAIVDARAAQFSVRLNPEIGRDERDELWMELPNIHIATLELLSTMLESFAEAALPIARIIFDQTMTLFEAEQRNECLRITAYRLTKQLLSLVGHSLTKPDVGVLKVVIKRCCTDLSTQAAVESLPFKSTSTNPNGSKSSGTTSIHADSFASRHKGGLQSPRPRQREQVYRAAFGLLPCFLETLLAGTIPHSVRTEIDRTAILVQNRRAMLASVLNPPTANKGQHAPPSIMPFLARVSPADLDIEGLLRPRMPLIYRDKSRSNSYTDMSEGGGSVGSLVGDHADVDDISNTELPEALDLLDRLEHSLGNSPVDRKQDVGGPSMNRTVMDVEEPSLFQSLSKNTPKRDLAAVNHEGAHRGQDIGFQDFTSSHLASDLSTVDIKKKRRLDDHETLDSENAATTARAESRGLHETQLQVAAENSSPHTSAQGPPKKGADALPNVINEDTAHGYDSDAESDFEMPEIVDSTSEDDGG